MKKAKQKSNTKRKFKICIVKRRGHIEDFDERKVYASCYAACLSSHTEKHIAEKVCENVCRDVKKWADKKQQIYSKQIFQQVIKSLSRYNKDAAFVYETHRDIG